MNVGVVLLGGVQLAQSVLEIYSLWRTGQIGDEEALGLYRGTIRARIKVADAEIDKALAARRTPGELEGEA